MDNRKFYPVRRAKADEWEDAMELVWKTFLRFEAGDYSREGIDSFMDFISDENLHKMFLAGEYHLFVALDGQKIVGVITVRSCNHISLLFVDEHYHRQGIGRNLINYVAMFVQEEVGYRTLTVNAAPYAYEFYIRLGFKPMGAEENTDGILSTPMTFFFS